MALIDTSTSARIGAAGSVTSEAQGILPPKKRTIAKADTSRARAPDKAVPAKPVSVMQKKTAPPSKSKTDIVLKKLQLARGVSIPQLVEATGWQAHSVRGFLSSVIRKKLGLVLSSEVGKDGIRRYRVEERADDATGQAG